MDTINGFYFNKGFIDNKISDIARQVTIQQSPEKINQDLKKLTEAAAGTTPPNK